MKPIKLATATLACLVGFGVAGEGLAEVPAAITPHISHAPILGRLGADSITVWARTSRPASFYVRYGTRPDNLTEQSGIAETRLDHDNTAQVALSGLGADTRYFYQVVLEDHPKIASDVYSFRSLPSQDEHRGDLNPDGLFNFAFSATSCAKQSPTLSQGKTQHRMLFSDVARDVSFHVALGDWLYEKDRLHSVGEWLADAGEPGSTLPKLVRDVPTLPGAWEKLQGLPRERRRPESMACIRSVAGRL